MKYLKTSGIHVKMFENYIRESIEDKAKAVDKEAQETAREMKKQLKEEIREKEEEEQLLNFRHPYVMKPFDKSEETVDVNSIQSPQGNNQVNN